MENKTTPFFSIVIPTKNRPSYLRESIQSVLLQKFDDYELIVSDNYNEAPTQHVIQEFKDHSNFNSYRTDEELNMIDHWEFATKKAKGKYVILLADRKVLINGSLNIIAQHIKKHSNICAFSFGVKTYDDTDRKILNFNKFSNSVEILKSEELARNFLDENIYQMKSFDYKFPKALNGCYKNSMAKKVREDHGHYFNTPGVTTPDFSSLFVNLNTCETVGYLSFPIILTQGEKISNGKNFGLGKFNQYMMSLRLEDPYSKVPIKGPFIYNLLYSDFITIKERSIGNLSNTNMNWVNFYATNKFELNRKLEVKELDHNVKEALIELWENAFNLLDKQLQVKITERENQFELDLYNWNMGNRKKSLINYIQIIIDKFKSVPLWSSIFEKKYRNALHAANFK